MFGGGEAVAPGLLVGVGYVMKVDGAVVLDTTKRPQVFLFGQRKGFAGGLCAGTEEVLRSMRQGGRRVITVPPEMAFGDRGTTLPQVPNPRRPTNTTTPLLERYRVPWADCAPIGLGCLHRAVRCLQGPLWSTI